MQRHRLLASAIVAAIATANCGLAGAVQLDYTIDAGIERNDNVAMSTFDPIAQTYLRSGLGFVLQQRSSTITASIDGRVEYRDYRDDIFNDSVDGTLSGRVDWAAIPQRLHFTIEDNLSLQSIDALVPNSPGNQQQVNVVSLGPTLLFKWARTLDGQLELRYIDSRAEVTDEFDSQRTLLALRTIKQLNPSTRLSLNLQGQDVDFDHDLLARDYKRYDAYARYARTSAKFDIGIDAGYSRLDYRSNDRRSDPLLRGDLGWHASERSLFTLTASSQFSDTAADALAGIAPNVAIPGYLPVGNTTINPSAYRERRVSLGYAYTGTRLRVSLAPYAESRRYLDTAQYDYRGRGGRFDLDWRVRQTLSFGAYAAIENQDYSTLDRRDNNRHAGLHLQQDWSRHWRTRLEYVRYQRSSSFANQDAKQNLLYLSMIYSR